MTKLIMTPTQRDFLVDHLGGPVPRRGLPLPHFRARGICRRCGSETSRTTAGKLCRACWRLAAGGEGPIRWGKIARDMIQRGWLRPGPDRWGPTRATVYRWTEITDLGREVLAAALGDWADAIARAQDSRPVVLRLKTADRSMLEERHPLDGAPAQPAIRAGIDLLP